MEQQISIFKWFLWDHVIVTIGVKTAEKEYISFKIYSNRKQLF